MKISIFMLLIIIIIGINILIVSIVFFSSLINEKVQGEKAKENTDFLLSLNRDCIKEKCVNLCNNLNEKASQIDFNTNKGKVFCKCGFEILEDKSNWVELNNEIDCKEIKNKNEKS